MAAVYEIRNLNQVAVWRRDLNKRGVEAPGNGKQGRSSLKSERRSPLPQNPVTTDSAQAQCGLLPPEIEVFKLLPKFMPATLA